MLVRRLLTTPALDSCFTTNFLETVATLDTSSSPSCCCIAVDLIIGQILQRHISDASRCGNLQSDPSAPVKGTFSSLPLNEWEAQEKENERSAACLSNGYPQVLSALVAMATARATSGRAA